MSDRVVIHHPQEPHRPTRISRARFDPAKHRLWQEEAAPEPWPESDAEEEEPDDGD